MDRNDYIKLLSENIVLVVFRKVNGEVRKMKCTLRQDQLPSIEGSTNKEPRKISMNTIPVFDVEAKDWRSFRIDSVISFDMVEKEATVRDCLGKEIKAGDTVLYATVRGSSAASLETRFVVAVKEDHIVVASKLPIQDKRNLGRIYSTTSAVVVV